jgi:diguanylate cyclase
MDFSHSLGKAGDLAGKALQMMQDRGIPPHPNNFIVWYSYCSGEFPDLNYALDLLLEGRESFDEERNDHVYRRYCASPNDAVPVHLIAEKVEAEVSALLGAVEAAVAQSTTYGDTLERARDLALAVNHPQAFRHLIVAIVERTRTVTQQTRDLEKQLRLSWKEVAELREQLEGARREALTDPLTGLANRKMFEFVLREAALEAMDGGDPLSVLLLDIDHFKLFNDTYGHAVGDQVLKLLAATLRDGIKGQDTAARYGGEEFGIILPNTGLKDAARLAEAIRRRVTGKTVIHRKTGGALGRVSVSIGVAQHRLGEPLRKLIERADKALYLAKHAGRNRVMAEPAAGTAAAADDGPAAAAI